MARARNIKPAFFQNEDLVELSCEVRLLFIGLWTIADREGRLENRPKKIKMQLFPADDLDITKALLGLAKFNLVSLYVVDNVDYIQITNFLKHQHPHHKEAESVIPEMITSKDQGKTEANPSDSLLPITDSLNLASDPLNHITEPLKPKENTMSSEKQILDYLNIKTGKQYKPVDSNLSLITQRLKEGHSVSDCMWVIDAKTKEWLTDDKFNKYLRPATLFNASKFNGYIGEKGSTRPLSEKEQFYKSLDNDSTDNFIEGEFNAIE